MRIAAFVPNLMDRSKVTAAAAAAGHEVVFAPSPAELDAGAELVVVDLSRPGALDAASGAGGRVIGFASHVDRDLMSAARAAGYDQVLARSAFFSRLQSLFA